VKTVCSLALRGLHLPAGASDVHAVLLFRFPVVGAVVVACGFAVYSIARNIMTNPEVHITKASRMEGVPESGVTEARAAGYKDSVYRSLQAKKENTKIFG